MTRGARKLEAVVGTLGFAEHVRDARAVDVGASTGGFTRTLLEHGAREVLAVDVGHGQLEPALRADPRVRVLERVDWKKLPPAIEPGPFDAFTVDVSFVAARNMLRGLAFRLRPGAHGVVLVKPQFELPEGAVAPGAPGDAALRARALARFRDKAAKLGFTVLGSLDSPVPGASGTIELFAHLRFDGWSARPAPGEGEHGADATAGASPAPAAAAEPARLRWFAITAPGLEAITEAEIAAISGVSEVQRIEGGVGFGATLEAGFAVNLRSRTATRLLARVGTFRAEDFASFRRRAAQLDWLPFLVPGEPVELHVTAKRCKLFHTGAVAENVEHALRDWSRRGAELAATSAAARAPAQVFARGSSNRWTLSVDASGELLHRRGWRTESVKAPLRETLAAAILRMCEWDGTTPLVDPMCGAGTLVIEAAGLALGRAPGLERSFACERWPSFAGDAAERVRAAARGEVRAAAPGAVIVGYDRDPAAVRLARRNAERAHVESAVLLHHGDLRAVRAPEGRGLVIVNPPYGRRLGDPAQARATIRELGEMLRTRFAGWRIAVLAPETGWSRELGLTQVSSTPLRNGGTRIHLLQLVV